MMYDHTSTTGCSMCSRGGMSTGTSVGQMVLFPRTMEIPRIFLTPFGKELWALWGMSAKEQ